MAEPIRAHPVRFAHRADEPLVFYGPPQQLRATLRLHNTSDQKVKLQTLALESETLRGPARMPLQHIAITARLYPDEQLNVPVTLRLDPTTPPGTYEGSVQVGERKQPVVIHVTEVVDFRLSPDAVTIYTEGEREFEREFVIENAGNIPLRLGDKCIAPLVDSLELRSALLAAIENLAHLKTGEETKAVLDAWAHEQGGYVYLTREDITLQPGEVRAAKGTFHLPNNLQRFHRYFADMELYNASLHLDVYTGELRKPARSRAKE